MPATAAPNGTPEPPVPPTPKARARRWSAARIAWFAIGAFLVGLLSFALLAWLDRRDDDRFFHAGPRPGAGGEQAFEPLPSPDAGGQAVGDAPPPAPAPAPAAPPETAPAQAAGVIEDAQAPATGAQQGDVAPAVADGAAAGRDTTARPLRNPPPRYPPAAMQRGESGIVLLEVDVDATGAPTRVAVVRSSRSRILDREALRAVQAWQFAPATHAGQPVPSTVRLPIDFKR